MNNKILLVIVGVIIGIAAILFVVPAVQSGGMMFRGIGSEYGQRSGNNFIDRHFIEQMIPHHDGAIAMAKLALTKSSRSEIKTLAEDIIEAQTKENQEMKSWYKSWFNKDVSEDGLQIIGGMMSQGGMHMGGREDIGVLENAADFDKEFIKQMIPHHQLAIMMAQMLKAGTNRSEMLSLANNIIGSQSREIQDMQNWYKKWYQ